jgi:ribosomal protein L40E
MVQTYEEKKEYNRKYYQNNKQKINERRQAGDDFAKKQRIAMWKHMGIVSDDYDAINTRWEQATECEECNANLPTTFSKCADHDHHTGEFRKILCRKCNGSAKYRKTTNNIIVNVNIFYV